jgi:hypothetical protein
MNDWKTPRVTKIFTKFAGKVIGFHKGPALNISYPSCPDFEIISRHRGVYSMVKVRVLGRDKLTYVACHWLKICCTTAQVLGISSHGLDVVILKKRVGEGGIGRPTASLPKVWGRTTTPSRHTKSSSDLPHKPLSRIDTPHKAASCLSLILAKICRHSSRNK